MADSSHNSPAVHHIAIGLLALGVVQHYGWNLVSPEVQSQVWCIISAFVRSAFVVAIAWRYRSLFMYLVAAFWLAEEAMIAGCYSWYIVSPWVVPPGQAMCSSLLNFDLGKIGAAVIAALIWLAYSVKVYR